MKKLVSVLLTVTMLATFALCGGAFASEADDGLAAWGAAMKELYGGTTINGLFATHVATTAFTGLVEEFTELTGINLEYKAMASIDMKALQRTNSASSGGAFDIYMMDCTMVYEFAEAGYLKQLDDYLQNADMTPAFYDADDILPAYWGLGKTPAGTFAAPVAGESIFVGYRTDLFEEHGKEIPASLDEMLELARYFNDEVEGVYGMAMRGTAGAHAGVPWMSLAYCFTDSPVRNMQTGEYNVNNPDSIKVFEYVAELAKTAPPDVTSYTHEEATAAFAQGRTALWMDATTLAATIENPDSSSVVGNVDYFVIPDGPAGGSGAVGGWTLAVTGDAPNPDPAWAFIMFVTSKAKSVEYSNLGGAPNRASVFENEDVLAAHPFYAKILEAVEAAVKLEDRGLTYMYSSPYFNDFRLFIGNEMNRLEAGEIDAPTAAAAAQVAIDERLAEDAE